MQGQEIFGPFFAMMLVTFVVWLLLYKRRVGYLRSHRVHPQKVKTREKVAEIIPDEVQYPAHNFSNLLELPLLFYLLCLYLFVTGNVDTPYVIGGWVYVALRALHSVIQCTTNIVMRRFAVYMASSVVLWLMIGRAAIESVL